MINLFYEDLPFVGHLNGPSKVLKNLLESLEYFNASKKLKHDHYNMHMIHFLVIEEYES